MAQTFTTRLLAKARLSSEVQTSLATADTLAAMNPNQFSPFRFGAKGGSIDDTAAVQAAVDAAQASGSFPGGVVFLGDHTISADIVIKRPRLRIIGGRLRGGGIQVARSTDTGGIADLDVVIDGVTIDRGTATAGKDGITIFRSGRVRVINCTILNVDRCIYVPPFNAFQQVRRISVINNHFENYNYAFYGDVDAGLSGNGYFGLGDLTFANNYCVLASVTHFWARGLDGLIAHDNTMFFDPASSTKMRHYDIGVADWVNIHDDHLFESGAESILVDKTRETIIHHNNIAWPGQRVQSSGIKVTGGGPASESIISMMIQGNYIAQPTLHGIEIGNPSLGVASRYSVQDNLIVGPGSSGHYTGSGTLSTNVYAVLSPTGGTFGNVQGNTCAEQAFNLNGFNGISGEDNGYYGGNVDYRTANPTFEKPFVMTSGSSIDTARGYRVVKLNHPSATNITNMTVGHYGHEVKLIGGSGNVTLVHSSTLKLKGAVNVTIPTDGIITMLNAFGTWIEQARNF